MKLFYDTVKFESQRRRLVNSLRDKGISNEKVLDAILRVPRHLFMDQNHVSDAYVDKAFPIAEGQTISQPFTVAYQTQLLEVIPSDKVLEIGTGSGYQASVLAAMGCEVYTVERQKKLFDKNRHFDYLKKLSNLHMFYCDGFEGLEEYAPFDKILITAAAPEVPEELIAQLNMPGTMVLPLGKPPVQEMTRIRKIENGEILEEKFGSFSFVPMLKGKKE